MKPNHAEISAAEMSHNQYNEANSVSYAEKHPETML